MSLVAELKRRNVFRVALFYIVSSWLLLQIADLVFELLLVPDWTLRFIFGLLLVAFPFVLFLAWAYELTPEGIKRESEVDRSQSITPDTGRKLNTVTLIVAVVAIGMGAYQTFQSSKMGGGHAPSGGLEGRTAERSQAGETPSAGFEGDRVASRSVPSGRTSKSVAVLPFSNLSDDPQQVYFVDGLAEEILNRLAHIPGLLVTARTSSFQFRDTNLGIPEIADKLGVAHVVEGSVRRFGDQLRVTAQLIRASDGFHVWSENYDREIDDLFEIQDDIAQKIANALDVFLDDEQRKEIQNVGTRNVEAFELWTRAIPLFDAYHTGDDYAGLLKANLLFERAIALDPDFSAAHLYHSDLYTHFLFGDESRIAGNHPDGLTEEEAYRVLQADLKRAEELAIDEYARVVTRLDRLFLSSDWREVPAAINRLEEIMTEDDRALPPNQWSEVLLTVAGRADLAVELTARTVERNPLSRFRYNELAGALAHQGNTDEALQVVDKARDLTGDHPFLGAIEAKIHYFRRDAEAVLEVLERYPEDTPNSVMGIWAASELGLCDLASRSYSELIEGNAGPANVDMAWAHAWMGGTERVEEQVASMDRSPVAAALYGRGAWTYGVEPLWNPSIMPNITRQYLDAGRELVRDQTFEPRCQ